MLYFYFKNTIFIDEEKHKKRQNTHVHTLTHSKCTFYMYIAFIIYDYHTSIYVDIDVWVMTIKPLSKWGWLKRIEHVSLQ